MLRDIDTGIDSGEKLKESDQTHDFPVSPPVIRFLHYSVIKIGKIELPLQGKLVVSIQKIERERGARTLMGSRIPPEPQKLYVPGDVESILNSTPTEREIDLMNT
jgi:hypothetical protein